MKGGLDRGRFSVRKIALGTLLLAAPFAVASLIDNVSPISVSAEGEEPAGIVLPDGEEGLEGTGLSVAISSSTSTNTSQSFTMTMTSAATTGYNNGAKRNNVFVTIDDDSYDPDAVLPEGADLPTYNARVEWIDYSTRATEIYIPKTVTYRGHFVLNVTTIAASASYTEAIVKGNAMPSGTEEDYGYGTTKATKIIVPSTIEGVEAGAFKYLPESISFEFEGDAVGDGFVDGWTDCPAERMSFNKSVKESEVAVSVSANRDFGKSNGYIIGYYEENEYYAPLTIEYDLYKKTGELYKKGELQALDLISSVNVYDAIGGNVGPKTFTLNVDIEIDKDEYVDPASIIFHNIYSPVQVSTSTGGITFIPDFAQPYRIGVKLKGGAIENVDISTLFTIKPNRVSTFSGYMEVDIDMTPNSNYYQLVNPSTYATQKEAIESGIYSPRVLLFNLRTAKYEAVFKAEDGSLITVRGKTGTPIDYVLLENDKVNTVGFTFSIDWVNGLNENGKGTFSYESLVDVSILGFSVKTDLWINSSRSSLKKSDSVYRFGALSLLPESKSGSNYLNITSIILIVTGSYLGVAILAAVGYYIYAKRRFRNDEFRRVNDKAYLIAAAKNIVGFGIVTLAILFIISRFGIMLTTIVTFNPLDVFVIVFTIAGAIFIGFAIKNLVNSIRDSMKRKNYRKLKIGQDKAEDGTR